MNIAVKTRKKIARPFLKWAGGKTQLLKELSKRLPMDIHDSGVIDRYIEPFVGGGAFFFYLKRNFEVRSAYIMDINPDLILAYKVVQNTPYNLIEHLEEIENKYLNSSEEKRDTMFYSIREKYNEHKHNIDYQYSNEDWVIRTAYLIFLNKTCFNGLFRQNKSGGFNVPFGKYTNPKICDSNNILAGSDALLDTKIICGDFDNAKNFVDSNTLIYFDPPYRPISKTSSFTDYAKNGFGDTEQERLRDFYITADKKEARLILSNSDGGSYFDDLYNGYNIERVKANRMINCNGKERGKVSELIIRNYFSEKKI